MSLSKPDLPHHNEKSFIVHNFWVLWPKLGNLLMLKTFLADLFRPSGCFNFVAEYFISFFS